ncbi:MAG: nuclear transport factor 2 family protein [Ekhidna sp.]|uniref:YybH family protein n=1 Tax=Ekhidna sp. TaxID=2608089 RepID=UPI0032EDE0CF
MKKTFTLTLLITSFLSFSQSAQEEIDTQIWIPFTKAWEANDGAAYNAIHSDDVWRINPGRLLVGDEYKSRNAERMTGRQQPNIIEFSFEHRMVNGDNAYEVGYYRISNPSIDEPPIHIGRFHVALKKIDGKWKITQDWDTSEINGERITYQSVESREFTHFE